jgi:poly-beta-hydroxybutyrate-responsive repressor
MMFTHRWFQASARRVLVLSSVIAPGHCMHEYEPRNFVEPCLLLLLEEEPTHGYQLVEQLKQLGIVETDSSAVYRSLRHLESQGLVRSAWYASNSEPARRIYRVTPSGVAALHDHARAIRVTRDAVNAFLVRYGDSNVNDPSRPPGRSPVS